MRLQLSSSPPTICLDNLRAIECNTLERVDRDQNYTTIGVDTMLRIAVADGMQNYVALLRAIIEIAELNWNPPEGSLR